jgi:hypothetical protein
MKESIVALLLVLCYANVPVAYAQNNSPRSSPTPQNQPAPQKPLVTLRGRVVDAKSGEALGKVRVTTATEQNAITEDDGTFTLENLPVGQVDLYITTVNYGLVKKTLVLSEGSNAQALIALNEDAAALTETVTITSDPFHADEANAPSQQSLNKRELQSLSSVLIGDPLRAAQTLPGATANDDFRSEFSLRGATFDRIGIYLDDVITDNFVHTVQGGYPDTGSLSVINADTVDVVLLLSGAFPSPYGDRTAAILDVRTRDGNRVKPAGRIAASLSGLSATVDGPLAGGRGSYLFAGRKSYLGYLVRRINDENQFTNSPPILGFADFQGKALYDLTKRNQIGFSLIYGALNYDRNRDRDLLGLNTVFRGNSRNLLVNGHWTFTPNQRVFWQTRMFGLRTSFKNTNRDELMLEDGHRSQFGVRSDVNFQPQSSHRIETGLYLRRRRAENFSQRFFDPESPFAFGTFNQSATDEAYYVQNTWRNEPARVALTGGIRVEHSSLTGQTLVSPRGSLGWSVSNDWAVRAGVGRYHQFPDFEHKFGRLGNPNLPAQSATHYNASVERVFGTRMRVLAEVYDREDTSLFFGVSEPRQVGNQFTFVEFPFRTSLRGHARGVELTLQRRSANRLAGWISYAYSRTKLTDDQTGLSFVSDADQRHTVNVYGSYRFTDTWSLSGAWRYGSGQPIPGFFDKVGPFYFLASERNRERVPAFSRLDLRVNKAFLFTKWKLTVIGEVINVFNRENVRFAGFEAFDFSSGRVFGQLDRTLPILPSAGVVIEF